MSRGDGVKGRNTHVTSDHLGCRLVFEVEFIEICLGLGEQRAVVGGNSALYVQGHLEMCYFGVELGDGGMKTLRLCRERGEHAVEVGLALLEGVDEGGCGCGSVGCGRGMDGLATLEGAYEICVLLYDEVDHLALLFCRTGLEFELAFACFGGFFARAHAGREFVRAVCGMPCSGEFGACVCQFRGAFEEGDLCERDLVGDASEGEGEFLYLCYGRVGCCVWVCAESVDLVVETGVLLLERGDVFV